ncbi:glycosyltransferase family 2 protein [Mycoplasma phocoeninasale]|uniref:Glycosyltransferase family 2 protein n=1 Tax=Mycoplasma phocoeninasale TaxID=2726117 RepID=A0A858U1W8_9MOLU|nr:glycosyltransferase family 2 protein [Mycoplasma phocoeninasale]QJG66402.1 glycosyltransferase family 2 protein [Mycoplasma phocoeninasale]
MKSPLTIIVPIYKPTISIDDIFHNLLKQKDQNFKIVITIDKPSEYDLDAIAKLQMKLKNRISLIINTSHQHITSVLKQAMEYVKTEYTYVLYSYTKIKSGFIKNFNEFISGCATKPDFIEVLSSCKGIVEHKLYGSHFSTNKVIELKNDLSPFAYAIPFAFAAIMKTEIFRSICEDTKLKNANLQYTPYYTFSGLILSKTFAFINTTWVSDHNNNILLLNPKSINKTWTVIETLGSELNENTKIALEFAKYLNFNYFIAGYLGSAKFKRKSQSAKSLKNLKMALFDLINEIGWNEKNKSLNLIQKLNLTQLKDLASDISSWNLIFKKISWD